jgi:Spy/CpxP family protein refolding chaperone
VPTISCPVCGFLAVVHSATRARVVWAEHLLGGCGDDSDAIAAQIEAISEQRRQLWRIGTTEEVPELTAQLEQLWAALRYARA